MKPNSNTKPTTAPQPERAEAGTCQYLVREDGKQRECGDTAAYKGRSKPFLIYCKQHGEFVCRSFEVVALDGSGRVLKPWNLRDRRNSSSL